MSAAPDRLTRRPARTVPAVALAIAALLVGGLGVWVLGAYLIDGSWPAPAEDAVSAAGAVRLDDLPVLIGAAVLGLLGLVLVLCALAPGDPRHRAILEDDVPGQTVVSRRDLARRVQRRVEHVDGVHDARVSVRRRRIEIVARTPVEDTATVLQRTRSVVEDTLAQLRPTAPLRPRVRIAHLR